MRDDVVDLPGDPGPLGGRGELGLLVSFAFQALGPVYQGRDVGAPGPDVVTQQQGERDQQGVDPPSVRRERGRDFQRCGAGRTCQRGSRVATV